MTDPAELQRAWTCLGTFTIGPERTAAAIASEWLRARNIDRELGADDVMYQNLCGRAADGSWLAEARIFLRNSVLTD